MSLSAVVLGMQGCAPAAAVTMVAGEGPRHASVRYLRCREQRGAFPRREVAAVAAVLARGTRALRVRLPGAQGAIVDPAKVRDYMLSPSHPVGWSKARFLRSLGYAQGR